MTCTGSGNMLVIYDFSKEHRYRYSFPFLVHISFIVKCMFFLDCFLTCSVTSVCLLFLHWLAILHLCASLLETRGEKYTYGEEETCF